MEEVRVDKWLWAVRVFKTRSIATEACKKGRVSIGGVTIKPSRTIRVGEVITSSWPLGSEQSGSPSSWRMSPHKRNTSSWSYSVSLAS